MRRLRSRAQDLIEAAFEHSVDGGRSNPLLGSRLHDFGFRGCTSVEQSVIGGVAHLLNFDGSDTMSACYYAQFVLNGGQPIAQSVPATEHRHVHAALSCVRAVADTFCGSLDSVSVMTAWATEREALEHMIENFGSGVFACVMDRFVVAPLPSLPSLTLLRACSYDYEHALSEILPAVAKKKLAKGGFMVLRPDSGDPVQTVVLGLRAAEKVFGCDVNSKGFKVPRGCSIIQGAFARPPVLLRG